MRIVAGHLGGRVLRAPAGQATRPTSEKVREAIFAILGDPGPDDVVLDLFAGSGAVGLEALSRGAGQVTFVDKAAPALVALRGNVATLGVAARATVVQTDALAYVTRPPPVPWTLVFIDPPYKTDLATRALATLGAPAAAGALGPGAVIIVEHDRRNPPPATAGSLLRTDERRYGDTHVSFFRVPAAPTQDPPP